MSNYNDPTPIATVASDLRVGDRFLSDRTSEGEVEVVYDFGTCPWDDRPESVYVKRAGSGIMDGIWNNGWFIAIPSDWVVHLTHGKV
jgi:hypothetical protein